MEAEKGPGAWESWRRGLLDKGKPRRIKPEPYGGQKGLETWGGGFQQTDPKRRGLTARARPQALSPGVFWKRELGPSLVSWKRSPKLSQS